MYRVISFEKLHPDLSVRVLDDSNLMVALDLFSVLAGNDRKRASQILARVASKSENTNLLTLRQSADGKKAPRKLISFSNAIDLLLTLPKRTATLHTRRVVADILANFFEATADSRRAPSPIAETLAGKHLSLQIEQQTMELEQKRKQYPMENLLSYIQLRKQCGPIADEEAENIKRMVLDCMRT
jgi:hypothetical protein